MKKVTLARRALWLLIVAPLALARLASAQFVPSYFLINDVEGRYISAENAADTSSVHAFAAPDDSLVGPPIPFATVELMLADGQGHVCGESDGFYSGISAPGVNLGPSLYHGTYIVETNGRVTIETCSDGAPSATNKFCAPLPPCAAISKVQVGYLSGGKTTIVTVEQTGFGTDPDSTGFLVHKRVWTK